VRDGGSRTTVGRVAIAALVALVLGPAAAPAAQASIDHKLDNALDRIVASPNGPPGLSVLLRTGSGREFLARGTANVKTGRRPTVRDHYRIASMSKAFNGAVALALVDRGILSLDDTVGEWLPGVLPFGADVTVGQALHHTGGLPDYIRSKAFLDRFQQDPQAYLSPLELVGFVGDTPLDFPPGSKYHYSDTDNVIVGLIAERATGMSYDALLRRYIYRPLGLGETSLPRTVKMPKPFMHGYEIEPGAGPDDVTHLINPAGAWASGGIVSTPNEVGRFFRAYIGARLFSPATRALQRSFIPGESSPPGPGSNDAGLGVFRYRAGCGTVFGHTGSFPGYRLFAASSGNGRRSVVFSVNSQIVPGSGSQAVSDLIRRAQRLAVCKILRG
jgi:D-alanyl-D-alanine carboxypeptidase